YSSGKHKKQGTWSAIANNAIPSLWMGSAPRDTGTIESSIGDCVDFQLRIGCQAVILPSPLTIDSATTYADELAWLDAGISYCRTLEGAKPPVYATVALQDITIRYADPTRNPLLDLILDAVSAREIQGVYVVVEQASEASDTRQCGSTRVLGAVLHVVHLFANEARLKVGVNFLGPFGLACEAAGAAWWASNWYKSLYRLRLADKLGGGRSYPLYWSYPAALDVHLETDFDSLVAAPQGLFGRLQDQTSASDALLRAAAQNHRASVVPGWRYQQGNVAQAIEHYLLAAVRSDRELSALTGNARLDHVENWLKAAVAMTRPIRSALGQPPRTKTDHVLAWQDAFLAYRKAHNV
ncbi:MAG: hypothetical protein DMG80_14280, partial [Acidobacteria bacterium]